MLTPDEIRVKEFLTSLRGYDADEVRTFLDTVAASFEAQETEHARIRAAEQVPEAVPATAPTAEFEGRIVRLTEELELALWTMRRLEAAVQRLEERLDRIGGAESLAG